MKHKHMDLKAAVLSNIIRKGVYRQSIEFYRENDSIINVIRHPSKYWTYKNDSRTFNVEKVHNAAFGNQRLTVKHFPEKSPQ